MSRSGLPLIAGFWHGSDFSFLEQVVARSYLDAGHRFRLFTLGPLGGVPDGVEMADAGDVLAPPFDLKGDDRHRVAVYSDLLRLHLLAREDCIWVDLDAYCVRSFDFPAGPVFGQNRHGRALTGVMRLPEGSEALRRMTAFVMSECPVQPWRSPEFQTRRAAAAEAGKRWSIVDLPWGCSGPKAFSHFLRQTGEMAAAQAPDVFYPVLNAEVERLLMPGIGSGEIEKADTRSVHIFGFTKRIICNRHGGVAPEGSYLSTICARHGVVSEAAPVMR